MRIADLVEAEGRSLREMVVRLGGAVGLLVMVVALSLSGIGLLLAGVYRWIAAAAGPEWASGVTGAMCLAIAGGLLWVMRKQAP